MMQKFNGSNQHTQIHMNKYKIFVLTRPKRTLKIMSVYLYEAATLLLWFWKVRVEMFHILNPHTASPLLNDTIHTRSTWIYAFKMGNLQLTRTKLNTNEI